MDAAKRARDEDNGHDQSRKRNSRFPETAGDGVVPAANGHGYGNGNGYQPPPPPAVAPTFHGNGYQPPPPPAPTPHGNGNDFGGHGYGYGGYVSTPASSYVNPAGLTGLPFSSASNAYPQAPHAAYYQSGNVVTTKPKPRDRQHQTPLSNPSAVTNFPMH